MVDRVAFVLHRDLSNLFLLDSVLVHVPPHLQRENPEQSRPKRSFENLIKDAPESVLRVRVQGRHLLFGNTEASVVKPRGDIPPTDNRRKDSRSASNVDPLVGLSDSSHPVKIVFSFHVHSVESVWR